MLAEVGLGLAIGLLIFLAYLMANALTGGGTPLAPATLAEINLGRIALALLLFIPNGFGEELAFRGYLQSRLVERYRPITGILVASLLFVPLHLLTQSLSPLTLLSGLVLWVARARCTS